MEQLPKDMKEELPLMVVSEGKEREPELPELTKEPMEKAQEVPASVEEIERVLGMTETVTRQVRERELLRDQERWGKGTFGKVKKWLNTTDVGRGVKVGGKIALGTLAAIAATGLTGGIGLLAAPALFAVGTSIAAGGAAEGLMHIAGTKEGFFKSGRNERIQIDSKREMLKKLADESFADLIAHAQEFTLKDLTERADELVKVIRDKESEITETESKNIKREKGRKLIAGLVGKAAAGGVGLLHGIPLGTQDFDKDGVSHSVRLMKTGFDFIYNQKEAVAQVAGHATAGVHVLGSLAGGGASHTIGGLGGFKGWWNVAGAAVGLAVAGGALAKETYDDVKNFRRNDDLRDQGNYVDSYKIIPDKFKHPLDPKQIEITDSQTALLEGKEPMQLTGPIVPRFVGLKSSTEAPKQSDSSNDLLENEVKEPKQLTSDTIPQTEGKEPKQLSVPNDGQSDVRKGDEEAQKTIESSNDLFNNIEEFHAAQRIIEFENENMKSFDEQFIQGGKPVTKNKLLNIKQNIIGRFNHGQPGQRYILYGNMNNIAAIEKQMDIIRKESIEQKKGNPKIAEPAFRVIFSDESENTKTKLAKKSASSLHLSVQVRNFLKIANARKSSEYELLQNPINLSGYVNDLLLQKEYARKGINLIVVDAEPTTVQTETEDLSNDNQKKIVNISDLTKSAREPAEKESEQQEYEPYSAKENIDELTHQILTRAQQGDQVAIDSSKAVYDFLVQVARERGDNERDAQALWITDPRGSVVRFEDVKNQDMAIMSKCRAKLLTSVHDVGLQDAVWQTLIKVIGAKTDRLKPVLNGAASKELLEASMLVHETYSV